MKTVRIAARDASQAFKDSADFVCVDGVPDHITFSKAIAALDEDGGVLIPEGSFDLNPDEDE